MTANEELAMLKAKLAAAEKTLADQSTVRFKVSEKGALSVYGLGRFPVTLYLGQWTRLFSQAEAMKRFIDANRATLAVKGEAPAKA